MGCRGLVSRLTAVEIYLCCTTVALASLHFTKCFSVTELLLLLADSGLGEVWLGDNQGLTSLVMMGHSVTWECVSSDDKSVQV